jgi:hypothetical protein
MCLWAVRQNNLLSCRFAEFSFDGIVERTDKPQAAKNWSVAMTAHALKLNPAIQADLARIIEPLAGYICATDRPREALRTALALLCDEVQDTSHAALLHVLRSRRDLSNLLG